MTKQAKLTEQEKTRIEKLKEHLLNLGLTLTMNAEGHYVVADKEGKYWRPISSQAEFFCAAWDNEPLLNIPGEKIPFIRVDYKS